MIEPLLLFYCLVSTRVQVQNPMLTCQLKICNSKGKGPQILRYSWLQWSQTLFMVMFLYLLSLSQVTLWLFMVKTCPWPRASGLLSSSQDALSCACTTLSSLCLKSLCSVSFPWPFLSVSLSPSYFPLMHICEFCVNVWGTT